MTTSLVIALAKNDIGKPFHLSTFKSSVINHHANGECLCLYSCFALHYIYNQPFQKHKQKTPDYLFFANIHAHNQKLIIHSKHPKRNTAQLRTSNTLISEYGQNRKKIYIKLNLYPFLINEQPSIKLKKKIKDLLLLISKLELILSGPVGKHVDNLSSYSPK